MMFHLLHILQSPRQRAIHTHLDQITQDVYCARAVPETVMQVAIVLRLRMEKERMPLTRDKARAYTKRYLKARERKERREKYRRAWAIVLLLLLIFCWLALYLADPVTPPVHHYTCYGSPQVVRCTYDPGVDGVP